MATQPPIIGSGHPHTVSLPDGSHIAASKAPPKAHSQMSDLPPPRAAAKSRGAAAESKPAGKASRAGARPARKAAAASEPQAVDAAPVSVLSDAIIQRIAQLQQNNDAVRAQLDRLPASAR